jgi:hypothetical protein
MDDASGNPQQIGLTANVIDPVAQFNMKTLSFGGVAVHGSMTSAVQLTNIGETARDISNVTITGERFERIFSQESVSRFSGSDG